MGDRAGTWSLSASGNWRIPFTLEAGEICNLDLEDYHQKAMPPPNIAMRPAAPGEFIREEILDELGLSVSRAAEIRGVGRATLSNLVNGNAALSPDLALRVEKAFGVSMDTLLRMQAWHDGCTMRQRAGEIDVQRFIPAAE